MRETPAYPNPESAETAIILVHYGDAGVTRRCLESLARHEPAPHRLFIADHGPARGLAEALAGAHPHVRILERENLGFASGCNAAAEAAFREGCGRVWFLNNDAVLEGPVLTGLLEAARIHPEVALWGTFQRDGQKRTGLDSLPRWFPDPPGSGAPRVEGLPATFHQLGTRETLSGASILVERRHWDALGPWPEWCFLYWEDVAWCLEAHAKGLPLVMTDLEVAHRCNTATGHHSPLATYYGVRNGLLLHRDLWPEKSRQRFLQGLHLLQKRLFQGNWAMLAPTLRGLRDAGRDLRRASF